MGAPQLFCDNTQLVGGLDLGEEGSRSCRLAGFAPFSSLWVNECFKRHIEKDTEPSITMKQPEQHDFSSIVRLGIDSGV